MIFVIALCERNNENQEMGSTRAISAGDQPPSSGNRVSCVVPAAERTPGGMMIDQSTAQPKQRLLIDVSHTVEDGMITYKGLPAPMICDYLSREASRRLYSAGTEFQIGKIEMVANTGTYIDSPFHRFAEGKDLAALELDSLADLRGVVVQAAGRKARAITHAAFAGLDLRGKAVLVHTGWDRHWRTDQYFEGHPFLTSDAAQYLVEAGARLVGIDSYNIDDIDDGRRPVHTSLLGADIPIVEHLCGLQHLPNQGFRFFAVPVKIKGFGTFPVRAFAIVD
jgi:kynurenine formamidase